jgi:hypothetical protein
MWKIDGIVVVASTLELEFETNRWAKGWQKGDSTSGAWRFGHGLVDVNNYCTLAQRPPESAAQAAESGGS